MGTNVVLLGQSAHDNMLEHGCPQVVSRDIRRILTQRAFFFNIVLDDVSITQLTFSKEYTHAVERKQVAQQDAERAKFIVSAARNIAIR